MSRASVSLGYLEATRHPHACFIFVLPLLAAYELGVLFWGSGDLLRNGADCWLRNSLAQIGVPVVYGAPFLLSGLLFIWMLFTRQPRPADSVTVWVGMTIESVVFAVGLYSLSKGLVPILPIFGVKLETGSTILDPGLAQLLSFLGAGIYEEALFRLALFGGLWWIARQAELSTFAGLNLAAMGSALLFAAAHHWGPCGEPFVGVVFLFRTLAGFYFAWLYHLRGFGIAVGAHAGYDVLVGIFVPGM